MASGHASQSGTAAQSTSTVLFVGISAALLVVAGRPIFTDDVWWHLSLGRAFASFGPWLLADPILHTTEMPPVAAAWLSDLFLHGLAQTFGLNSLRCLHVLLLAVILGFVWRSLKAASHSGAIASLGSVLFIAFSAYRLVQLRPELASILATLLLYTVLLQRRETPSWQRVACAALICCVWANLHPGFLLGPILIAGAAAGVFFDALVRTGDGVSEGFARAHRLMLASLASLAGTFVNPLGAKAHLLYFAAGNDVPQMTVVVDEWSPLSPFQLPTGGLPPSLAAWVGFWILALAIAAVLLRTLLQRSADARDSARDPRIDGALFSLAGLGLVAPLIAVRFLWLSFFPLLLVAIALRRWTESKPAHQWVITALVVVVLIGFVRWGDWAMLSSGLSRETYREPYAVQKYYGHSVAFLRDTEVEGNLYNNYFMGGFLGYWLAPQMRIFVDGSLHVPPGVMEDYFEIQANGRRTPEFDATALLDRHDVDVFLGIGVPTLRSPNRPWRYSTRHLEGESEWIAAFRSQESSVYLRRNDRNRANLDRIDAYYRDRGVPFGIEVGFDPGRAIDEAPDWAIKHGLIPQDFQSLVRQASLGPPDSAEANQLAALYTVLGLEERALKLDTPFSQTRPLALSPRRRRIAAFLRLERIDEALIEARNLSDLHPRDALSHRVVNAAHRLAELDPADRRSELALLPVLTRSEANRLANSRVSPEPRAARPPSRESR